PGECLRILRRPARNAIPFTAQRTAYVKIPHSLASLLFCGLIAATTVHATEKKTAAPIQELASGSALLVDLKTNEILYSSNPDVVVPIASVTKLMTAMVALDAKQPLDERVPIAIKDVKEMRGVFSRVKVGSQLSRRDMLQLALMSS